ncbi:hypothetical protein DYY67_1805 [Candidatus Nitrosotalea sp. TS]|nr:hypothetical protein [Candidatus Nitrosotalea sp. TS]
MAKTLENLKNYDANTRSQDLVKTQNSIFACVMLLPKT